MKVTQKSRKMIGHKLAIQGYLTMKTATASNPSATKHVRGNLSGFSPSVGKAHAQATSIVLKTTADPKRQHAAINKLIKMCKASPLVTTASKGITAEVRRDRDRAHE